MRILVISDIHANLTALEAVLEAAGQIDSVWCLGDLVGYGPDPNECIARIRELPDLVCIMGNHDAATLGLIPPDTFNPEARQAIEWTRTVLNSPGHMFLNTLQETVAHPECDGRPVSLTTLAHGSPRQPVWEYLLDTHNATRNFSYFDTPFCFVGHTHMPVIYHLPENKSFARLLIPEPNSTIELQARSIVNPGSVGQPRDRDPRASFAIFDSEQRTWECRRVNYDIPAVQQRMRAVGLPGKHIRRLSAGW